VRESALTGDLPTAASDFPAAQPRPDAGKCFPGDCRADGNRHGSSCAPATRHRLRRLPNGLPCGRRRPNSGRGIPPLWADEFTRSDHAAGAVRPAGERPPASSGAGIVLVLDRAGRRDDAGDDAHDHHDHPRAGCAPDGPEEVLVKSSRRSKTSAASRFSAATKTGTLTEGEIVLDKHVDVSGGQPGRPAVCVPETVTSSRHQESIGRRHLEARSPRPFSSIRGRRDSLRLQPQALSVVVDAVATNTSSLPRARRESVLAICGTVIVDGAPNRSTKAGELRRRRPLRS